MFLTPVFPSRVLRGTRQIQAVPEDIGVLEDSDRCLRKLGSLSKLGSPEFRLGCSKASTFELCFAVQKALCTVQAFDCRGWFPLCVLFDG